MASLLNMSQELYELARRRLERGDLTEGMRCLRHLLELPDVPPRLAAEANYLLAQAAFKMTDYAIARKRLSKVIERNPMHGEAHFLLARAHELDEAGSPQKAVNHYRRAYQLAPDDPQKATSLGRLLVERNDFDEGLALLQRAYRNAGDDPEVVENYVNGLLAAGRLDDAELVAAQAAYRNRHDPRFAELRLRIRGELLARSLGVEAAGTDGASQVLQYRNPAIPPEVAASLPTTRRRSGAHSTATRRNWHMAPVRLRRTDRLDAVLKTLGQCYTLRLHQSLELTPGRDEDHRAQVVAALLDPDRLTALVRLLPKHSRRALRSLVKVGGIVPATVLCQNTGPDAPPPDYLQPLLACGLVYFSGEPRRKDVPAQLLVVIPRDLCRCLARPLRVRLS